MIYLMNYDAGNLLSIKRALRFLEFEFLTIKKVDSLSREITSKLILKINKIMN